MVHTKSTRSVKSIRSTRSSRSVLEKTFRDEKKGNSDIHSLDNMLLMACAKFHCPYLVTVKREMKHDDYYKSLKQTDLKTKPKRISVMAPATVPTEPEIINSTETRSIATTASFHLNTIAVTMVYDNYNTLTEIHISKVKDVPRVLLTIITLLVPYYKNLTRITINKCGITMYSIYELSKTVMASTITEICLDGSPISGVDYTMLMETTKLRNLSLCMCNIDDGTCKLIAAKLHFTESAQNLLLLNLSSNRITDKGVEYISNALRTNRHLRYLNLADNHITDCGAGHILDVLIEFPLTHGEIMKSRRRHLDYLKRKNDLYANYLSESYNRSFDELSQFSRKSTTLKRRKTSLTTLRSKGSARKEKEQPPGTNLVNDFLKTKAEMLIAGILGPYQDPFHPNAIKFSEGYVYSIGNMTLGYLNLAYNNLTFTTVKKIQNVVQYQNMIKLSQEGLIKVVLEGNNLPTICHELNLLDELMARNTWRYSSKISENLFRKGRVMKGKDE